MRKWFYLLLILVSLAGIFALLAYNKIFKPNVNLETESIDLYVPTNATFSSLMDSLESKQLISNSSSFNTVSKWMKFQKPKPGKYHIKNGWNNRTLISHLRSGKQNPIKLTFNNLRTIEQLAGYFGNQLEADSLTILNHILNKETLSNLGYNKENILSLFIPNTYELYWNSSPKSIVDRMSKENNKFFNNKRLAKAKKLGLDKKEVYTLASIVQKETLVNEEKPRVAGVYLNRLKRGILLQADPTVVFAVGDFAIKRVLTKHLAIDSPYNTYRYEGLPPGPISMPDISSIDAVLNPEAHKYLYFCAKTDNSGRHVFAKTLKEHNNNANKYRHYLNTLKIYR